MNLAEAQSEVERHMAELAKWQHIGENARRQVAGLAKIIGGYVEIYPQLAELAEGLPPTPPVDGVPRGAEAVRIILQETPGVWWMVSELVHVLRERDWLPTSENPANAVRTALERLRQSDTADVYKSTNEQDNVIYKYDPDYSAPTYNPLPDDSEEPF